MKVLGLDASTSTIGYAILESDPLKLTLVDYWKPPKKGSIWTRLAATKQFIQKLLEKEKPDVVVIEDILLFAKTSTAKTITSLAIFNRTVGLTALETLGIEAKLLAVATIRARLKRPEKGAPRLTKEEIPERVAELLGISFPYRFKKTGKSMPENNDMADAIAVALAYLKEKKTNGIPKSSGSSGTKQNGKRGRNKKGSPETIG